MVLELTIAGWAGDPANNATALNVLREQISLLAGVPTADVSISGWTKTSSTTRFDVVIGGGTIVGAKQLTDSFEDPSGAGLSSKLRQNGISAGDISAAPASNPVQGKDSDRGLQVLYGHVLPWLAGASLFAAVAVLAKRQQRLERAARPAQAVAAVAVTVAAASPSSNPIHEPVTETVAMHDNPMRNDDALRIRANKIYANTVAGGAEDVAVL